MMIPEIHKLQVLFNGSPVGILQDDRTTGSCIFEYEKEWLSNGFSLSPTELPLQEGLLFSSPDRFFGNFAIFEDSLPDGYGLYLLNRILKSHGSSLKELSPLQRLSIIGNSGMGALSYLPIMKGFSNQRELERTEDLDMFQAEALKVLGEKEPGDVSLLYYNSGNSGGERPKVVFRNQDGSHCIVKFRHEYDPHDIGRTEYLYMKTAGECGIRIPRINLLDGKYFCVERFDMDCDGKRIHTATAAALLKRDFRRQDVDYTDLLALTGFITQNSAEVEEMFRRMVMNLICINKDDHAKNFSFICKNGKWSLSPAYDITYSPTGTNGEHATSLYYKGNPTLDLVIRAGVEIRIPKKRCMEIVEEVQTVCGKNLPVINPLIPLR